MFSFHCGHIISFAKISPVFILQCTGATFINSLWPNDAIWRQGSRSTLVQVMACCLTAPGHYLDQCWLIINGFLWYSPYNNFTGSAWDISSWYEFENHNFDIPATSPMGQWVKPLKYKAVQALDENTGCINYIHCQFVYGFMVSYKDKYEILHVNNYCKHLGVYNTGHLQS